MADKYTKFVLTTIAVALVVIAANNITRSAAAQIGYAKVQICDEQNCTRLIPIPQSVGGRTVYTWSVPVVTTR
jgi:hypothetical protein